MLPPWADARRVRASQGLCGHVMIALRVCHAQFKVQQYRW